MSNLENYEAKLAVITAIPEEQIVTPNMPVEVYIKEAENLNRWCQEDKDALVARGLDWTLVEDLPIRIGAFMEAESRWKSQRYSRKDAGEKWASGYPEAYELRDLLLHEFRFAYRDNEWLSGRVKEISEGTGHADMLQDLNDLAVLGKENPDPLIAINLDMTLLDKAAQIADEKFKLWADASYDRTQYKEAKKIRDQAYTHLKEAVDTIRDYGTHVFWKNEVRLKGYQIDYFKRRPIKKDNNTDENVPPDSSTITDNEINLSLNHDTKPAPVTNEQ